MNINKRFCTLALTLGLAFAAPAHAVVLFSDNFDSDATMSALNFNSLTKWTVSDGTIDYIRSGDYGISCVGGTGGCLDMDGSTNNAGRITSKAIFTLVPGAFYFLEALVSGSQRVTSPSDDLTFGLVDATTDALIASATYLRIPSNDPFTLRGFGFSFSSGTPLTVRLFIEDSAGTDNLGVILDNVVFRSDEISRVPEPATLGLLGVCLGGLALMRRRKR